FATNDRITYPAPRLLVQEAADGVLRIFGERRRLDTHNPLSLAALPAYVERYLQAVAVSHNEPNPNAFVQEVRDYLITSGCLDPNYYCLLAAGLRLLRPFDVF